MTSNLREKWLAGDVWAKLTLKENELVVSFIEKEISLAVADERKKVVKEIQVIADTTPPNLLLNAIVSQI